MRAEKPAETEAQPASSQSSGATQGFKKPTPEQVVKLVKSMVSMGNESRSISQALGEKVAKAVENLHFDKKALGIVKGLYQMSVNRPEAFAITLPHLLAYIDDLRLGQVADEHRGLAINGEDDDDGQIDLEDAIEGKPATGDDGFYDSHAPGHRLSVVPGPNAPSSEDDKAA